MAIGGGLSGTTPGIAIGVSIARNLIGWAEYGDVAPIQVRARAISTSLTAAHGVWITAGSTEMITATVAATAVAIAASSDSAYAVSVGGLWTDNKIGVEIEASADPAVSAGDGDLTVSASDTSHITADAQAAAVAASLSGGKGGSGSIGLSLAHNSIDKSVTAFVKNAGTIDVGGDVVIRATNDAQIKVQSIAVALSAAVSGGTPAFALAGGGSESTNVILSSTSA